MKCVEKLNLIWVDKFTYDYKKIEEILYKLLKI